MKRIAAIVGGISALLCISCAKSEDRPLSENVWRDGLRAESFIKNISATDPVRALHLIGEGEKREVFSEGRASFLRANVYYQSTNEYADMMEYALQAYRSEEVQQNPQLRVEVLHLMADITEESRDFADCLEYCTEGKDLAHQLGSSDEFTFDFIAGRCLFVMGRIGEGLQAMREAVSNAEAAAKTEADFGHLNYFLGNLVNCYYSVGDMGAVIEVATRWEGALRRMEARFPEAREGYYDRERGYLFSILAAASAAKGETVRAAESLRQFEATAYSATKSGKLRIQDYYAEVGDVERVLAVYEEYPFTEPDTVSRHYRYRLARIARAYRKSGDTLAAAQYEARLQVLTRMIDEEELRAGALVKASDYNLLDKSLKINDMLGSLRVSRRTVVWLALVLTASLVSLALGVLHHRRKTRRFAEQIEKTESELSHLEEQQKFSSEIRHLQQQTQQLRDDVQAAAGMSDAELFVRMDEIVERDKLYLQKELSLKWLAHQLGVTQMRITDLLRDMPQYGGLAEYLNDKRVVYACQLFKDKPFWNVEAVWREAGFNSSRSFYYAFTSKLGMRPSQYRRAMGLEENGPETDVEKGTK